VDFFVEYFRTGNKNLLVDKIWTMANINQKRVQKAKEEILKNIKKVPHLFLISPSSFPNFITEIKKEFSNSLHQT